ncbi:GNAT family N-acetyltransferase [Candidatus Roizmanbacteria bacterium CG11_big_fil_rev_8_21_14_0_20_36_8]|uniref:GNAT family N-acetyltransferase n=1 Tax=Candidatus Roizmanbacteria bacterium CG11_big_fil_rev_8_21_14_0_20_36_8 TaxID=1974856 RepID=A0A2M6IU94_9BACT|nr:MAG: GNAT family N-acetyltransferase [Candidatus Roizmanbacteria bacterium CG11_big_fil_rev_8_21_14_0_20_36_8]
MNNYRIEKIMGELDPEDKKVMVDGMLAYHASKGHPRKTEVNSILLKNKENKVKGAVVVSFLWNGMHIDSLWIDETLRNLNWGSKLMEMAEEEAIKRGCTIAYTDTFTWQAPDFYKKLGYTTYGELEDFPKGNSLYYLKKFL